MTLIAITQEPEVKVAGKWCNPECNGFRPTGGPYATCDIYSTADKFVQLRFKSATERVPGEPSHMRCPACIAAHGGAE